MHPPARRTRRGALACLLGALAAFALVAASPAPAHAQTRTEYRAFWVDTFNTTLNNHNDVVTVVNRARAANANALLAQVRRRGDAWYVTPLEPKFANIQAGFDPLDDLVKEAHAYGIEVHAFVIMGSIWISTAAPPNVTLPASPLHAFNQHGGYDPVTKTIVQGPDNWLTRTLLPDNTANGITFQGHRFGSDFWVDFGHPAAAEHTVNVLTHLVRNYDIDGLHLDRIRYPELTATGQTPTNGTNIGYNQTSVARFNARHNRAGNPPPSDALWKQWRRDQVTNIVRRVYLESIALKPSLKVSAALIAFGGGPTTEAGWLSAEAYWRVYQDWRAWTEEGIIDLAIPMAYKREHNAEAAQFQTWSEWLKNHQYNRGGLMGQGSFVNSIEGTLRQTRSALQPSAAGNSALGVSFYSMATSNVAVTNNPLSLPPGQTTPARTFAELASGLTTGKSVSGAVAYENATTNPTPIFAAQANVPVLPWKAAPTAGHLKGFARRSDATPLDTAEVTITNLSTGATRQTATDGGGFYGGVDLQPGRYLVRASLGADAVYTCVASVEAGAVTNADAAPETVAPTTTAAVSPAAPPGQNGWYTGPVSVSLSAADDCSGVGSTEYSTDGGATWQAYTPAGVQFGTDGVHTLLYRSKDRAGNEEAAQSLTVKVDATAPALSLSADPSTVWPPNGKNLTAKLSGEGSDAASGLASVNYVVTDEYGTPLSIPARTLSGASGSWFDLLDIEASRRGGDTDGRLYRVVATLADAAGNTSTASADIVVLHDRRKQ
jgi:uncharacterized lipoprotein YddW (UPF0748 family)